MSRQAKILFVTALAVFLGVAAAVKINLVTQVQGILGVPNGGTGSSTQQGALTNILPVPTRTGDIVYFNGSFWTNLPGNVSGVQFLQELNGVPSWVSGGASGLSISTNGTNNTSQNALNFVNPAAFQGLSFTFSNPASGNETFSVSGSLNAAAIGALPGTNGQLLFNNNGAVGAEDPVVSQPTASLLNATVVQGTGTNLHTVVDSGSITATQATGSNLHIVCDSGCGGASSFADNAAFTAGTTAVNPTAGWFSNSPTACTSGSACAPSLTSDRKLFVQAFQGTSPWVMSLTSTTITGTVAVTQSTSPWVVSCTAANCALNLSQVAGTALGATAIVNYGSTPAAVAVPGVNAFITNTPAVTLASTTITGTVAVTESGNWTNRIVGNGGAVLDAAGQNVAAPANWLAHGCVFFTSPTTITTGNGTYLNCDASSNLLTRMNSWLGSTAPTVGSKTSANSIPVVIASDQGAVTVSGTVTTTPPSNASTNITQVAGTTLGATAVTNFGTAPAAAAVPGVNASLFIGTTAISATTAGIPDVNIKNFGNSAVVTGTGASGAGIPRVTISNDSSLAANQSVNVNQVGASAITLGQKAMASSFPVVLASDQTVISVTGAGTPSDAFTNPTNAVPSQAFLMGWNNASWDRIFVETNGNDTEAVRTTGNVSTENHPMIFNGTTYDRARSASVGNNVSSLGLAAVVQYGQFNSTLPALQSGNYGAAQLDQNGRQIVYDDQVMQVLRALYSKAQPPVPVVGTFNRPVGSTGDALNVNIRYPAPSFDPCLGPNKGNIPISTTANKVLIPGTGGVRYRICSMFLISTSAETFSIVEGTGATCGTSTAAIVGGTTAANGPSLAANGGFTLGNGGGSVAFENGFGNDVCIFISGSTLVAGNLTYAF